MVEADYSPIDLRSEMERVRDMRAKINNYVLAEKELYITAEEAAIEARWIMGLNPKIPAELLDPLKKKHVSDSNQQIPPNGGD
ncbi:hypothetical protein D3C78_1858280 [compost metagenome]